MSFTGVSGLDRSIHKTNEWLTDLGRAFGTEDRAFLYRVLRAWLHLVRDRLPVDDAAHLAAQLPELLRGVFYEGWAPSQPLMRRDRDETIAEIASAARIARADVPKALTLTTEVARRHLAPGTVSRLLDHLPADVRRMFAPATTAPSGGAA